MTLFLRCALRNRYLLAAIITQTLTLIIFCHSVIGLIFNLHHIRIDIALAILLWTFIINLIIGFRTDFGWHTYNAYLDVGESILRTSNKPDIRYAKSYNYYCGRSGALLALKDAKKGRLERYINVRSVTQLILDAFNTTEIDEGIELIYYAFWQPTKNIKDLKRQIRRTIQKLEAEGYEKEANFCKKLAKAIREEAKKNPDEGIKFEWFIQEILTISRWCKPENIKSHASAFIDTYEWLEQ